MKQTAEMKIIKELAINYLGIRSKAADSALLNGFGHAIEPTSNSIAQRDASGDINVRLIRSNYQTEQNMSGAIAIRRSTTDNYVRFCDNPDSIRTWLGAAPLSHSHSDLPLAGGTLTGVVMSNSDIKTSGKMYVGASTNPVTTAPSITLAIGDADTGFSWLGDGSFSAYNNNQESLAITTAVVNSKRILQENGQNVYHTGRKPTPEDIGAVRNEISSYEMGHCYNYEEGCLVLTNIPSDRNAMMDFIIYGNGYSQGQPIHTIVNFYNYHIDNSIISFSAIALGLSFNINAFNYNGVVAFWFKQPGPYLTTRIKMGSSAGTSGMNISYTITNQAMPTTGVTRLKTIVPVTIPKSSGLTSEGNGYKNTFAYDGMKLYFDPNQNGYPPTSASVLFNGYQALVEVRSEAGFKVFGSIQCTSLSQSSDIKTKENVLYLNEAKKDLITSVDAYNFFKDEFKPASFNYIDDKNKAVQLGFIAQDLVNSKVGELILNKNDKDELLSYNPSSYTTSIAMALQEALIKIDELEETKKLLSELIYQNKVMEAKISILEEESKNK